MANREPRRRAAFTLIELAAVLALTALILAVASVRFRQTCRAAEGQFAREQLSQADRRIRDRARRFGRAAELTIDLEDGVLYETEERERDKPITRSRPLGKALRIERVVVGARRTSFGRATIAFSAVGESPTYALRLRTEGATGRWLTFAGATGQVVESDDDTEVEELFRLLAEARPDAH